MKTIVLACLAIVFFSHAKSQISASEFKISLKVTPNAGGSLITCTGTGFSASFTVRQKVTQQGGKFLLVDSQVIQISPLVINGLKKSTSGLTVKEQEELLSGYAKYELDYYDELKVEVIDPRNQWVPIKNRYWYIWYFKVGKMPTKTVGQKTEVQLYASTLVNGKVFTINAPLMAAGDFEKAGEIVNQMMESFKVK